MGHPRCRGIPTILFALRLSKSASFNHCFTLQPLNPLQLPLQPSRSQLPTSAKLQLILEHLPDQAPSSVLIDSPQESRVPFCPEVVPVHKLVTSPLQSPPQPQSSITSLFLPISLHAPEPAPAPEFSRESAQVLELSIVSRSRRPFRSPVFLVPSSQPQRPLQIPVSLAPLLPARSSRPLRVFSVSPSHSLTVQGHQVFWSSRGHQTC